jgi:CDP-glycerol glycerophosphotransferase
MQKLETVLAGQNYQLILSLHPKFARKEHDKEILLEHISYIESGWDIYPYLKNIDVLITDYSSLYVDFLLLDRPMIFYTYDYDTYGLQMGLHEDYLNLTPGPHPISFTDLLLSITETDTYQKERARVEKILFTYNDGHSAKRVIEALQ